MPAHEIKLYIKDEKQARKGACASALQGRERILLSSFGGMPEQICVRPASSRARAACFAHIYPFSRPPTTTTSSGNPFLACTRGLNKKKEERATERKREREKSAEWKRERTKDAGWRPVANVYAS